MGNFFSNFGSTYRRKTQINDTDGSGGQSAQPRKHFSWHSASVTRSCWLPWDGYIHAKGVVHITHLKVELQKKYRYRFLMLHLGGWVKFGTPSVEQWATQASKESLVLCDLQYICISSLVPWCLESESVKGSNQQTWHQATLQLNHLLASLMAYGATNAQKATQSWTK